MKTYLTLGTLFLALFLATVVPGAAQNTPAATEARHDLMIVVVESLSHGSSEYNEFNRIDRVFTEVFEQRKWPVKIKVERFAANSPAYETELRIFYQGIRKEEIDDLTFRAWMTFNDHGKKHDFGIVRFKFYPRPGQQREDALEAAVRGAADIAATKIEAILFPKPDGKKP
ncbi:MAG: hypothetical protein WC378_06555 [Opitutaceae bacterium]|jgi:hypothetical protein